MGFLSRLPRLVLRGWRVVAKDCQQCLHVLLSVEAVAVGWVADGLDLPTAVPLTQGGRDASYSMEVAFHTRKGMRQNANARDPETGWCYKNGGSPAWGYRTMRKERTDVRGRPRFKATWELNTEEVAGRPVWEWTREMLLRAGEGASLDSLRD